MDLDDLDLKHVDIEKMSLAEAIEYLRHIRLRRRISEKPRPRPKARKPTSSLNPNMNLDDLSAEQAAKILSLLGVTEED